VIISLIHSHLHTIDWKSCSSMQVNCIQATLH